MIMIRTLTSQQRGLDGKISLIIIACDADPKKNHIALELNSGTTRDKPLHIFNLVPGRFLLRPSNGTPSTDLGRLQLSRSANDRQVHVLHLSGTRTKLCTKESFLRPEVHTSNDNAVASTTVLRLKTGRLSALHA